MNTDRSALLKKKKGVAPISVITAYDFPTAKIAVEVNIDMLLVGDSVGTNVLGYASECEVTMNDMVHHLKAVVRGAPHTCIMVDLPFGAADTPVLAAENASLLTANGADIIKLEGWADRRETVEYLVKKGFTVCCHIGYNPQIHGARAKVFGRDLETARELIESAKALEDAGAQWIVIEKIPEELCSMITKKLSIPVIGIGSGRYTDGQVLVYHDIVGLSERVYRHAKAYSHVRESVKEALESYRNEVEAHLFPGEEQFVHLSLEVQQELEHRK